MPLRELAVLDGDPGLGKSAVTLDLVGPVRADLKLPDGKRCLTCLTRWGGAACHFKT